MWQDTSIQDMDMLLNKKDPNLGSFLLFLYWYKGVWFII